MKKMSFIKDYKDNHILRKSYCELANNIFGIDFNEYYEKGFWSNKYVPFSYVYENQVIANVSVNILDLIVRGEKKKALQIGTVMTDLNYRKQGLATDLMNKVLDDYRDSYDFMYLFANKNVLDFYPKFGFSVVEENEFYIDFFFKKSIYEVIHKLDISNINQRNFVYQFVLKRLPNSKTFSTLNAEGIFMFYCLNVFPNSIYYLEKEDVIIVFKKDQEQLHIFDIVSKKEVEIENILHKIADSSIQKVIFHYTPEYKGIVLHNKVFHGSEILFVKSFDDNEFPLDFRHPIMSQA